MVPCTLAPSQPSLVLLDMPCLTTAVPRGVLQVTYFFPGPPHSRVFLARWATMVQPPLRSSRLLLPSPAATRRVSLASSRREAALPTPIQSCFGRTTRRTMGQPYTDDPGLLEALSSSLCYDLTQVSRAWTPRYRLVELPACSSNFVELDRRMPRAQIPPKPWSTSLPAGSSCFSRG